MVHFNRPENANVIYDYRIFIDNNLTGNEVNIDKPFILLPEFKQGQKMKVNIRFKTNGIDIFKYKLDAYSRLVR
jgi:hypothetical protein